MQMLGIMGSINHAAGGRRNQLSIFKEAGEDLNERALYQRVAPIVEQECGSEAEWMLIVMPFNNDFRMAFFD